ncbi:hypothetical protein, partial [Pseudoalteromonas arctica]
ESRAYKYNANPVVASLPRAIKHKPQNPKSAAESHAYKYNANPVVASLPRAIKHKPQNPKSAT